MVTDFISLELSFLMDNFVLRSINVYISSLTLHLTLSILVSGPQIPSCVTNLHKIMRLIQVRFLQKNVWKGLFRRGTVTKWWSFLPLMKLLMSSACRYQTPEISTSHHGNLSYQMGEGNLALILNQFRIAHNQFRIAHHQWQGANWLYCS